MTLFRRAESLLMKDADGDGDAALERLSVGVANVVDEAEMDEPGDTLDETDADRLSCIELGRRDIVEPDVLSAFSRHSSKVLILAFNFSF